jgi:O-antigen biosynthesis protein
LRVCALLVTWNGAGVVGECLDSLLASDPVPDLLVIDNASRDDTVGVVRRGLAELERRGAAADLVVPERNLGFVEGANLGLRHLLDREAADLVLLLNQDAAVAPTFLAEMIELFTRDPAAGAAGGKVYFPQSRKLQYAGGEVEAPRMAVRHRGHHEEDGGAFDEPQPTDFVTGAALTLRASALAAVGVFDPIFSPGYYEDVELCQRLRGAGWGVLYQPTAVAWHHESTAFGDPWHRWSLAERNRLFYVLPWLADPDFRATFRSAELAHLAREASAEERRFLAAAYARALIGLGPALEARAASAGRGARGAFIELLVELRRAALASS